MNIWKYIGIGLLSLVLLISFSFALGWTDVFYTKTVGKAKQNAKREVFEETQSYAEGKRQEAIKLRLEYMRAEDDQERNAIRMTIVQSFSNFDENKLPEELRIFIYKMKY